jgi:hypothetical protein
LWVDLSRPTAVPRICLGGSAHEQVRDKLDLAFEDIGEQQVKNIARPVRVYRVRIAAVESAPKVEATPALSLPDKPSIAVLPFTNMSSDPELEFFADGIAENIITALSRYPSLFVIARNLSFTYKGRAVDVKEIGRELGVRCWPRSPPWERNPQPGLSQRRALDLLRSPLRQSARNAAS